MLNVVRRDCTSIGDSTSEVLQVADDEGQMGHLLRILEHVGEHHSAPASRAACVIGRVVSSRSVIPVRDSSLQRVAFSRVAGSITCPFIHADTVRCSPVF